MADPSTILAESNLVNALYGEAATTATATANAQALNLTAQGDAAEAGEYGIAAGIGQSNAAIAQVSGQIQQFQNTRLLMKTLGSQAAGIAGGGFAQSGSAIDLARSSLQQGLLQNQVIGTNATLQANGYFAQAAASAAEGTAATTASAAASANAAGATNVANLSNAQMGATGKFLASMPGALSTLSSALNPTPTNPVSFGFGSGVSYTPSWAQPTFGAGNTSQGVTLPGIGNLSTSGTITGAPTIPSVGAPTPSAPLPSPAGPAAAFNI